MAVTHPVNLQSLQQQVLSKDLHYLYQLSQRIKRESTQQLMDQFDQVLQRSVAARKARAERACGVELNPDLPVSAYSEQLIELIRDNQVVIVAGETGSGKTTQLPKLALMAGRGQAGQIGHTQPRRLAARRVAMRISEELGEPLGERVGFKIRFTDQGSSESLIKLMTDGILLNEMASDRFLNRYDTLIIDEAHERSLNIDFILGLLKKLLKRRADLKLIITSATLDTELFNEFFSSYRCAVAQVPGRSFPVEVIYRSEVDLGISSNEQHPDLSGDLSGNLSADQGDSDDQLLISAVTECFEIAQQREYRQNADILVFASTAKEIDELADLIQGQGFSHTEVLKLHARLPEAQQVLVFDTQANRARFRIIISTNIAETAVTVPGIRFVIDLGYHRISRYSYRSGVQRLPIERISQAAANQRAGRAGRLSAGICMRLYSSDDFEQMSAYTEPEIQRTNLASVILTMSSLKLGDPNDFDFIDRPDSRLIKDAHKLLFELGAVAPSNTKSTAKGQAKSLKLTKAGRQIAKLPIDPRLARSLCENVDQDTLKALCVICAALSIPDVRERPKDKQTQADQKHALFADKQSDFLFYLNLWMESGLADRLSHRKRAQFAKGHFLSARRLLEWQRLSAQLAELMNLGDLQVASIDTALIHRSLLKGLLGRVAKKTQERREYLVARNIKAMVFPGSVLRSKPHEWLMAYELAETSQVFLRCCAKIEPDWILQSAEHLLNYHYMEPFYSKRRGRVMASAQISLFGLVVEQARRVDYTQVDAEVSHQVFVQQALVEDKLGIRAPFVQHNQHLIAQIKQQEDQTRQSLLVDEVHIQQFFLDRIPADIATKKAFESWRAKVEKENPKLLFLTPELLTGEVDADSSDFPEQLDLNGVMIPLHYRYAPGEIDDGVKLKIPEDLGQQLNQSVLWAVPGWFGEQILSLLKGLDKSKRVQLQPLSQTAERLAEQFKQLQTRNLSVLAELINQQGVSVLPSELDLGLLPEHTRPLVQLMNPAGKVLEESKDLARLQQVVPDTQSPVDRLIDYFPETFCFSSMTDLEGTRFTTYHALTPQEGGLSLESYVDKQLALSWQRESVLWLLDRQLKPKRKAVLKYLDQKLLLRFVSLGTTEQLRDLFIRGVIAQALDSQFALKHMPVNLEDFEALKMATLGKVFEAAEQFAALLLQVLTDFQASRGLCLSLDHVRFSPVIDDVLGQLDQFAINRFTYQMTWQQFSQLGRYLKATHERLQRLPGSLELDLEQTGKIRVFEQRLIKLQEAVASDRWPIDPEVVADFKAQIQELRISLYAQPMKTLFSVSPKRLDKSWNQITEKLGLI